MKKDLTLAEIVIRREHGRTEKDLSGGCGGRERQEHKGRFGVGDLRREFGLLPLENKNF